jgi:hypothetical protein
MNIDEFFSYVLGVLPEAQIEEDNEGQLIIYTNLAAVPHPTLPAGDSVDASETVIVSLDAPDVAWEGPQ